MPLSVAESLTVVARLLPGCHNPWPSRTEPWAAAVELELTRLKAAAAAAGQSASLTFCAITNERLAEMCLAFCAHRQYVKWSTATTTTATVKTTTTAAATAALDNCKVFSVRVFFLMFFLLPFVRGSEEASVYLFGFGFTNSVRVAWLGLKSFQ